MSIEERDPDDPCFECLLDGNCSEICPRALPYFKAQVETRPGKWVFHHGMGVGVWDEETEASPFPFYFDKEGEKHFIKPETKPGKKMNIWWKIFFTVIAALIILLTII